MGKQQRRIVTWELRKSKDDDIADALSSHCEAMGLEASVVIRAAMRLYFGIGGASVPPGHRPAWPLAPGPSQEELEPLVLEAAKKTDEELDVGLDKLLGGF